MALQSPESHSKQAKTEATSMTAKLSESDTEGTLLSVRATPPHRCGTSSKVGFIHASRASMIRPRKDPSI